MMSRQYDTSDDNTNKTNVKKPRRVVQKKKTSIVVRQPPNRSQTPPIQLNLPPHQQPVQYKWKWPQSKSKVLSKPSTTPYGPINRTQQKQQSKTSSFSSTTTTNNNNNILNSEQKNNTSNTPSASMTVPDKATKYGYSASSKRQQQILYAQFGMGSSDNLSDYGQEWIYDVTLYTPDSLISVLDKFTWPLSMNYNKPPGYVKYSYVPDDLDDPKTTLQAIKQIFSFIDKHQYQLAHYHLPPIAIGFLQSRSFRNRHYLTLKALCQTDDEYFVKSNSDNMKITSLQLELETSKQQVLQLQHTIKNNKNVIKNKNDNLKYLQDQITSLGKRLTQSLEDHKALLKRNTELIKTGIDLKQKIHYYQQLFHNRSNPPSPSTTTTHTTSSFTPQPSSDWSILHKQSTQIDKEYIKMQEEIKRLQIINQQLLDNKYNSDPLNTMSTTTHPPTSLSSTTHSSRSLPTNTRRHPSMDYSNNEGQKSTHSTSSTSHIPPPDYTGDYLQFLKHPSMSTTTNNPTLNSTTSMNTSSRRHSFTTNTNPTTSSNSPTQYTLQQQQLLRHMNSQPQNLTNIQNSPYIQDPLTGHISQGYISREEPQPKEGMNPMLQMQYMQRNHEAQIMQTLIEALKDTPKFSRNKDFILYIQNIDPVYATHNAPATLRYKHLLHHLLIPVIQQEVLQYMNTVLTPNKYYALTQYLAVNYKNHKAYTFFQDKLLKFKDNLKVSSLINLRNFSNIVRKYQQIQLLERSHYPLSQCLLTKTNQDIREMFLGLRLPIREVDKYLKLCDNNPLLMNINQAMVYMMTQLQAIERRNSIRRSSTSTSSTTNSNNNRSFTNRRKTFNRRNRRSRFNRSNLYSTPSNNNNNNNSNINITCNFCGIKGHKQPQCRRYLSSKEQAKRQLNQNRRSNNNNSNTSKRVYNNNNNQNYNKRNNNNYSSNRNNNYNNNNKL